MRSFDMMKRASPAGQASLFGGAVALPPNMQKNPVVAVKEKVQDVSTDILNFLGGLFNRGPGQPWSSQPGGGSGDSGKWNNDPENGEELATFGAGCYWGTEKFYATEFASKYPDAILGTSVGFMHPDQAARPNPTYREVCSSKTGYVEVAHILFDNKKVDYEELVKFFYTFHDPTTINRQGNDRGT